MRDETLFLNGVYKSMLKEILLVQEEMPEQIMFLQPYKSSSIVHLRDDPPTLDEPMQLYISTRENLPTIKYEAEIVGWDNKREMPRAKRRVISRLIWTLQPEEGGLYDKSATAKGSVNLLHIRRLRELTKAFSVERLTKKSDGKRVSPKRTTSGGWTYVEVRNG